MPISTGLVCVFFYPHHTVGRRQEIQKSSYTKQERWDEVRSREEKRKINRQRCEVTVKKWVKDNLITWRDSQDRCNKNLIEKAKYKDGVQ